MKLFSSRHKGRLRKAGRSGPAGTLGERLGYGPDARLLIVHADDLGLAESVNASFISGLKLGGITSGSAMVPCPAFSQIAAFARQQPDADIGLHLTLTSQRADKPWASVAPAAQVPSLVDQRGCLHKEWTEGMRIAPAEVEIELRAQIEKARAAGLDPTHIDSHQFKLQKAGKGLFEAYLRVSRDTDLPPLVSRRWYAQFPYIQPLLQPRDIVLDQVVTIGPRVRAEQWPDFYRKVLESLPPGVSEILIHPAYDDAEMRALFQDQEDWGSAWRQRDYDFFTSGMFREIVEKQNIVLITWRDVVGKLKHAG